MTSSATAGANALLIAETARRSEWSQAWRRFRANRIAVGGLSVILLLVLMAVFAPLLSPHDPIEDVFRGMRGGSVEPPPGFSAEDFRVATFREVAERFSSHVLDVEIKLQRGPDGEADPRSGIAAAQVLAAEIAELGREDSVIVACFNDEGLAAFHRLAPDVATSPGTDELLAWWLVGEALSPRYRVLQVPFTYGGVEVVQPDLVERVHSEGRHVWVWLSGTDVFETREFYAELLRRGVDGVIAGRPATAVAALGEAL